MPTVDQPRDRNGAPLVVGQLVTIGCDPRPLLDWPLAVRQHADCQAPIVSFEQRRSSVTGLQSWLVFVDVSMSVPLGFWSNEVQAVATGLKHLAQRYQKEVDHGG